MAKKKTEANPKTTRKPRTKKEPVSLPPIVAGKPKTELITGTGGTPPKGIVTPVKKERSGNFDHVQPLDLFNIAEQALDINIECFSTPKICGILNHLAGLGKTYVEIGTYRGVTLASALHGNKHVTGYGIDNYSWPSRTVMDEDGEIVRSSEINMKTAADRIGIDLKHPEKSKNKLLIKDYRDGLIELRQMGVTIDCFFIDGPHGYKDVMEGFTMAETLLNPGAYVIIDDTNFPETYRAAHDIAKIDGWSIVFERLTGKPKDTHSDWWNGITILKKK